MSYELEIDATNRSIRQYRVRAEAREDMAAYLLEQAAEDRERETYWTLERNRFLGLAALDNVIPLRVVETDDIA